MRVMFVVLTMVYSTSVFAQSGKSPMENTKWPIDENDPVASVPSQQEANKDVIAYGYYLMELSEGALKAEKANDWEKARKFNQAMALAVPSRASAARAVCEIDLRLNKIEQAFESCRETLFREGSNTGDYRRFFSVVSKMPDPLHEEVIEFSKKTVKQLDEQAPDFGEQARCTLGSRLSDMDMLNRCVPALLKARGEKDPIALGFAWKRAIAMEDWDEAYRRVKQSEQAGIPPTLVSQMKQATEAEQNKDGGGWSWGQRLLLILALGAFGLIAFLTTKK